jgi:hypothetical protein
MSGLTEQSVIDTVLIFLKDQLNRYLRRLAIGADTDAVEDKVVFLDGDKLDPVVFKLGAVSVMLINIEEDKTIRQADRYSRMTSDGVVKVSPELRLDMCVLFVATFKQYVDCLRYISNVIQFFQQCNHFDRTVSSELDERIDKLIVEMISLPFGQQNEIWSALKKTYQPSVLYKVRTIIYEDDIGRATPVISRLAFEGRAR